MNYLEEYYSHYDEEGRLLRRYGQVEYLTTMKYVHDLLQGDKSRRIIEIGAGTGRYSVTLAREGYPVTAVELITHNLEILRGKLDGTEPIETFQGNALDLSAFADESFDLTLLLGPMYHLYTDADRETALKEAVRVTKPGGHICAAYCMNDSVVVQFAFIQGNIHELLEKNMITEDFHCLSGPEDLFAMVRVEEIEALTERFPVERERLVATDGASGFIRNCIEAMDEETFRLWIAYHMKTCERRDLIGATNHSLDILKKLEKK